MAQHDAIVNMPVVLKEKVVLDILNEILINESNNATCTYKSLKFVLMLRIFQLCQTKTLN